MHRNVFNVGAPDLVGPARSRRRAAIDLVAWCRAAQVPFRIVGLDSENAHQPARASTADCQLDSHATTAEERVNLVQFVELP